MIPMKKLIIPLVALPLSVFAVSGFAAEAVVTMNFVNQDGVGESAGEIKITESDYGLVFSPNLAGVDAGVHGFHVHTNPSCEPKEKDDKIVPALSAGGHFDPAEAGFHGSPWVDGHLGDLPALYVDADGNASQPLVAPRIKKLSEIKDRALMIHAGGDNHSDHPKKLGGGGSRVVCGVIQ